MHTPSSRETLRFGNLELDEAAYTLRRDGRPIKLGRQPMDLLIMLVAGRGQLVSRGEIIDRLWGKDVFVDVDTGVNTAISKIRQALRDSPDAPVFLETVAGKGYRFIAPVQVVPFGRVADPQTQEPLAIPERAPEIEDETSRPAADVVHIDEPEVAAGGFVSPVSGWPPRLPRFVGLGIGLLVLTLTVGFGAMVLQNRRGGEPAAGVTIAVLPFQNLGSESERDYLAAGLTNETSASLAQVDPDRLSVKGRSALYKDTTKTAAEIGRELSVDYLLESSIRAEGRRLRVTATLIRVKDQEHVWSQSYDREPTSLLGLQQELSTAIAQQIRVRLSPDRLNGLGLRQTENAAAYDVYLRGRDQSHRRTPDGNARAIALLKEAVAIDAKYALAWSDLTFAYAGGAINGDAPPSVVGPLAHDAVAHAIGANGRLSESQMALGYDLWLIDWDWPAADAALQRAVDLDPSNATAFRLLGHARSQAGRRDDAETAMRRARELDPLDALTHALSSQVAFQSRDVAAARAHARQAILLDPNLWIGYVELAQAYEGAGEYDLALEAIADAGRLPGGNSKIGSMKGYLLAKLGRTEAARQALEALKAAFHDRYMPPYAMALVYAGLGARDAMFEYLEKAYAARDVHLMYLPVDMKWDSYRTDPRFVDIIARCRFASVG